MGQKRRFISLLSDEGDGMALIGEAGSKEFRSIIASLKYSELRSTGLSITEGDAHDRWNPTTGF